MSNIITAREAAKIADVTTQYISYLVNAGEIKAERFGKAWAIDRASFEQWLARRQARQAQEGKAPTSDQGGENDQGEAPEIAEAGARAS